MCVQSHLGQGAVLQADAGQVYTCLHTLCSHDRPIVQGIPQWVPASPAEAKALPREGASALVYHTWICLYIHVSTAGHRRIPAASPSLQPAATAPQLSNPPQQPPQPTTSPFQAAAMARAGSTTLESRSRQGSGALQTAGSRGGGSGTLSVGRQASGGVQGVGRQGSGAAESGPHQMPSEEEDVFLTPDLPARAAKK